MLDFVIFAVTFLAALIIAIIWLYPSSQKVTTVPGMDPSTKEDGNLSDISRAGSLHEFLQDLHEQFGNIAGFWWGKTYVVSIASADLFKEHQNVFDKPSELYQALRPILGPSSIQFSKGSDGRIRRKHYDAAFSKDVVPFYCSFFQKVASISEQKLSKVGPDDHVPLTEYTSNYAFKSTLLALLGEEFQDDNLLSKMKAGFEKAWLVIEEYLLSPTAIDEDSPQGKQIRDAISAIHSIIREIVEARKKHGLSKQKKKLIDILIEVCPDEATLLSDAVTFITEGFQSLWNVLSWSFYFLATHEDVQDKLYKEIKSVLGNDGQIDNSNLTDLRYLSQVINETLRCAVVNPWTARVQEFDSELGGHKIPKNTPVIHALGVVMQDSTIWSQPNNFDPERFSQSKTDDRNPLAFPAFGFAGKRKCLGQDFTYCQASIFIATLIRRFKLTMCSDQIVQPVHGLVSHPREEIWMQVVKR